MELTYPDVTVRLTGTDGNVFAIIGNVKRAMKKAKVPNEEITAFTEACFECVSYDDVLIKVMQTVEVE